MARMICECCDRPFTGDPVYVPDQDGMDSFACCSDSCALEMHHNADPHCTCNDCIAELAERLDYSDDVEADEPVTVRTPTPVVCLSCGRSNNPIYDDCQSCGGMLVTFDELGR